MVPESIPAPVDFNKWPLPKWPWGVSSGLRERKKGGREFFIRMLLKCWLKSQEERTSRTQFGKNGYAALNEPIRYSLPLLSPWLKKFFKIHLFKCSRRAFPLSLRLSSWLKKISKITFLDALVWLFPYPFLLHHGWRKFSKITFSDYLEWLFWKECVHHLYAERTDM